MVNSCLKCGSDYVNQENVVLFSISKTNNDNRWQHEFVKRLGIQNLKDQEIHICSRHFNPDDLEMENSSWNLKENALPIEDENEMDVPEPIDIQTEVIYINCKVEPNDVEIGHSDNASDTSETKELASLEPLIEYVDVYEQRQEEIDSKADIKSQIVDGEIAEDNYLVDETEEGKPHIISVVSSEGNNLDIEPMMPFFLSSNPVFTIVNENDEVGETIILQIENQEERDVLDPELIYEHQKFLCKSKGQGLTSKYTCDICESSYGCLNCLKSHYETLHISHIIVQYKCKNCSYVSKHNTCPVCELTFETRNDTLDHYITHAVACDICGSGFDRQVYLTDHYKSAHNKVTSESSYECELCKKLYRYPITLANHYQNYHKMILCYICKIRFSSVSELQEHEVIHREKLNVLPFACSKCDKAFPKISDIAVHIRQDHKMIFLNDTKKKLQMPAQKKPKLEK